jgi:hypothetical protein
MSEPDVKTLFNYGPNGVLKSVTQVVEPSKIKPGIVNVPVWGVVLAIPFFLLIITILIVSLQIVYFAPRPGFYLESCEKRSCLKDLNLKCINNICQCTSEYYYTNKCNQKKNYMEKCHLSSYCKNNTGLTCLDGACKCSQTKYWKEKSCVDKSSLSQSCTSDSQCLDQSMLYCNTTKSKCACASNRYGITSYINNVEKIKLIFSKRFWDGNACILKRTINEECKSITNCQVGKNLTCTNGACKFKFSNIVNLFFTIFKVFVITTSNFGIAQNV